MPLESRAKITCKCFERQSYSASSLKDSLFRGCKNGHSASVVYPNDVKVDQVNEPTLLVSILYSFYLLMVLVHKGKTNLENPKKCIFEMCLSQHFEITLS